jgi:hypothetical protein
MRPFASLDRGGFCRLEALNCASRVAAVPKTCSASSRGQVQTHQSTTRLGAAQSRDRSGKDQRVVHLSLTGADWEIAARTPLLLEGLLPNALNLLENADPSHCSPSSKSLRGS